MCVLSTSIAAFEQDFFFLHFRKEFIITHIGKTEKIEMAQKRCRVCGKRMNVRFAKGKTKEHLSML